MGITLGGAFGAAMDALPPRQLATSEPFGPETREVVHEKTLPLPSATTTYHYEQFTKHDPTDVHQLPPQQSPIHHGPTGAERGIIIVGGHPGDAVSLNPQPLPPRNLFAQFESLHAGDPNTAGAERGIIIIGGRPGDAVSLNPQPLPPRNLVGQAKGLHAGDPNSAAASRGIIIVGGHDQANPELNRAIIIIGGKLR